MHRKKPNSDFMSNSPSPWVFRTLAASYFRVCLSWTNTGANVEPARPHVERRFSSGEWNLGDPPVPSGVVFLLGFQVAAHAKCRQRHTGGRRATQGDRQQTPWGRRRLALVQWGPVVHPLAGVSRPEPGQPRPQQKQPPAIDEPTTNRLDRLRQAPPNMRVQLHSAQNNLDPVSSTVHSPHSTGNRLGGWLFLDRCDTVTHPLSSSSAGCFQSPACLCGLDDAASQLPCLPRVGQRRNSWASEREDG